MVLDFSPLLYEIRGKNTGKKLWKLEEGKREKRKGEERKERGRSDGSSAT